MIRTVLPLGGVLLATLALAGVDAFPTRSEDPPPRDSVAAVAEAVDQVVVRSRQVAPVHGAAPAAAAAEEACRPVVRAPESCEPSVVDRCRTALARLLREVDGSEAGDALTRSSRRHLKSELADALVRLGGVRDAAAGGRCAASAPEGATPAALVALGDGETLRFRPAVALRGGRTWSLVLEGIPAETRERIEPVVPPEEGPATVPEGAFASPWRRADDDAEPWEAEAAALARSLEESFGRAGLSGVAGVQVRARPALSVDELSELRAYFVPGKTPDATMSFEVLDPRRALLRRRAALRAAPCTPTALDPLAPAAGARGASVLRGVVATSPRAGESSELEVLVSVPAKLRPDAPLVIAIDGHGGSAHRMLRLHAGDLTARGMMVAAIDLPEHGRRASGDREAFLDARDPGILARNLTGAAVDVMAVVRAAECGFRLPDGTLHRPGSIDYLGYSVGAMVGVIVRSVEEELDSTVLLAGGGDLFGWLMLGVAKEVDTPLVTCVGGPDHGASCFASGQCAPPGVCVRDPRVLELREQFALPHAVAYGGADPLEFARHRTGVASDGPLLLITAGQDAVLHPLLATRLADAYDMRVVGPHVRRGPRSTLVQWPDLGHGLREVAGVREQAYDFLETRGRIRPAPAWARESSSPSMDKPTSPR